MQSAAYWFLHWYFELPSLMVVRIFSNLLFWLQERIASPKWQNIELMMSVLFEQMQHAVDQRYVLVDAYGQSFKQLMTTIAVRLLKTNQLEHIPTMRIFAAAFNGSYDWCGFLQLLYTMIVPLLQDSVSVSRHRDAADMLIMIINYSTFQ